MDAHDEYSATGATFQTFNSSRIDDGIAFVARDHQPGTGNRLDAQAVIWVAIVILSVVLVIVIIYLIWDRATRCPHLNGKPNRDIEQGEGKEGKYPNTPDTIVDITGHCHDPMNRDLAAGDFVDKSHHKDMPLRIYVSPPSDEEPMSPSDHPETPSTPSSMGSPEGQEEFVYPGISIGDRLRSQRMVRETTGLPPRSAEIC